MDEGTEVQQITCWAQGCHRVSKWQSRDLNLNLSSCFLTSTSNPVSFIHFKGTLQQNITEKPSFLEKLKSFLEWIMIVFNLKYEVFTARSRCVIWLLQLLFTDVWHYPSNSWPSSHISISSSSSSYLRSFFFLTLSFAFENLVRTTCLKIIWGTIMLLTALEDFGEEGWLYWGVFNFACFLILCAFSSCLA